MLRGASTFIKKYKPLMAICLYHKPKDFFELPLYIHTLVPDYKMSIRHHTYSDTDTVLYCYL